MKGFFAVIVALSLFSFPALACTGSQCAELLERVRLQAGFKIEYYVPHALNARSLYLSPANILYIGTLSSGNGNVYAALDRDNDGVAEEVITIISGLNQPNGIAFRDGDLWVVEMTRIIRFDDIDNLLISTGKAPEPVVIRSDLPTQRSHGWRYASFSPDLTDPYLYIAIGADCNICTVEGIFGTVARFDTRNPTSELEIVAYGVRNSVGFTWHPVTGDLWFTDNGRDNWGDDRPGDELNRVTNFGLHYGYPYCYEKDLVDSQFNTAGNCNAYVPASQVLGPHVAALGNVFYTGSSFPKDYFLNLFIAEHGSWNRAVPLGYRVSLVKMNEQGTAPIEGSDAYTIFAEGWLPDGATTGSQSWGRPVDVKMMKDGSLLVSDDKNNAVYRISYSSGSTEDQESHHNLGLPLIIIGSLLVVFGFIGLIASIALYRAKHCNKCKVHAPKDSMGENLVEKSPQ